jgi:hypothetical protein
MVHIEHADEPPAVEPVAAELVAVQSQAGAAAGADADEAAAAAVHGATPVAASASI